MRKSRLISMLMAPIFLISSALVPAAVSAQEIEEAKRKSQPAEIFIDSKWKSQYVSSGTGGTIEKNPVIQIVPGVDTGKFALDLWANYSLERGEITEVDPEIIIPFDTKYAKFDLYSGLFTFPNSDIPNMNETGVTVTPKLNFPLEVYCNIYFAKIFGEGTGHGQIMRGTLGKNIQLVSKLNLSLSADATFNYNYFSDEIGFSHARGTASLDHALNKSLKASVFGTWQLGLDSEKFPNADNKFWFGFGISGNF